jgi:hypothetical protein
MDHEGYNVAQWLGAHGVATIVLNYRLARENGSTYSVGRTALSPASRNQAVECVLRRFAAPRRSSSGSTTSPLTYRGV